MGRRLGSLTKAERTEYDATVSTSHHRFLELEVYRRRDGKAILSLTNRFMGGAVHGDLDRDVVTYLECDVLDDDFALDWSNGEHRKFEVRVIDGRFVPALDEWVEEPVFHGPLWDFQRSGSGVHLVAEGPEMNAMGSVRQADHWPAKTRATVVLKNLLRAAGAEASDLRIPTLRATLPRDVTVGVKLGKDNKKTKKDERRKVRQFRVSRDDAYWTEAAEIAEALDRDLFGDNVGRFVLRKPKTRPSVRLTERTILEPVIVKRGDEGEVTNTWIVKGANPKGPKKRPVRTVELPKRHPSSSYSLRWNGTLRKIIETIENPNVKTVKQALQLGRRKRDRAARELVTYSVQALPVEPYVRPNTLMSVPLTGGGRATALVRQWTLGLGPDAQPLSLGAKRFRGPGQ